MQSARYDIVEECCEFKIIGVSLRAPTLSPRTWPGIFLCVTQIVSRFKDAGSSPAWRSSELLQIQINRQLITGFLYATITLSVGVFRKDNKSFEMHNEESILIILPPAVTDIPYYSKRGKSEIKNTGVHSLGRFFPELLGSLGTDGTLSNCFHCCKSKEQ